MTFFPLPQIYHKQLAFTNIPPELQTVARDSTLSEWQCWSFTRRKCKTKDCGFESHIGKQNLKGNYKTCTNLKNITPLSVPLHYLQTRCPKLWLVIVEIKCYKCNFFPNIYKTNFNSLTSFANTFKNFWIVFNFFNLNSERSCYMANITTSIHRQYNSHSTMPLGKSLSLLANTSSDLLLNETLFHLLVFWHQTLRTAFWKKTTTTTTIFHVSGQKVKWG